jgi:PAS domain S-box-containing protein
MSQTGTDKRHGDADEVSNAVEERLRVIIDTIPTIVWRKSPDGSADFLNRNFREYTGLSLEDGLGLRWLNAFHPDDRLNEKWPAAMAAGKPFQTEARLRGADGQYRWFLIRAMPLQDDRGNIVKWYGLTCEIEDLKRAEDRIRLIIDALPTMVWTMQPNGAVDFVNQRWMDYTGLSLEEEMDEPTRPVHPEDLPRVLEKWRADMAAGEASEDEIRLRRADGKYRWFLVRTAPLRDEHGNVLKWYGVSIDIEDRKQAEEALRSSDGEQRHIAAQLERERARLVEAQEVGKIGSWEAELPTLNVIWSGQTHRIFETDPSRFHATRPKFLEFVHPEDRAKVNAAFAASLDKRSPSAVEYRIVMPDGRIKFVEERWQTFHDEEGKPVRVAGTCRDISERVRADEELRQARERIESILNSVSDTFILFDRQWRYLYLNEAAVRATARPLKDIPGRTLWELFPQVVGTELDRQFHRSMDERRHVEFDFHFLQNGLDQWWEIRTYPAPEGLAVFATDVTERKRADEQLRQAEDRIRAILESSPNWIFLKDTEGRYLLVNREIESVFGISQEQIKGKTDSDIFPPEQAAEYRANDLKVLRAGRTMEFEEIADLEDGRHTSIVHKFPLFDAHGNIYATGGVATDITERKRADEQLRRLSGELLRLQDEERRRIARDLHDATGQDLVALATTLSQLRDAIPSTGRKLRKLAKQCQGLADRCIREVRTLSYVLHPPMLDEAGLEDAIRHYADGFTERTGIEVELEISPRLGRMNPDAEMALFRVVQESLTNIQRHAGSFQAKIRIERAPGKITLEISDKGSGIPGNLRRQNGKLSFGLGVGIPSMHERVKLIGGQLEIESSSSGTTVRVTLPADD